jgi:hypothetical protein
VRLRRESVRTWPVALPRAAGASRCVQMFPHDRHRQYVTIVARSVVSTSFEPQAPHT